MKITHNLNQPMSGTDIATRYKALQKQAQRFDESKFDKRQDRPGDVWVQQEDGKSISLLTAHESRAFSSFSLVTRDKESGVLVKENFFQNKKDEESFNYSRDEFQPMQGLADTELLTQTQYTVNQNGTITQMETETSFFSKNRKRNTV